MAENLFGSTNGFPRAEKFVSPVHPYVVSGAHFGYPSPATPVYHAPVYNPFFPAYPDPRIPLGISNGVSPMHPAAYSPRDPRLLQQPPMMPFQPPSTDRDEFRRMAPSRSQPAKARRRSYTSASSDSDVAEQISARILGSSDDPREMKSILKNTRKLRKHKSDVAPKRRDESLPPVLGDILSSVFGKNRSKSTSHKLSRSVTPPVVVRSTNRRRSSQEEEEAVIPAALDNDYFNEEPSPLKRRSDASAREKISQRRNLTTTSTSHTAIVVASSSSHAKRRNVAAKRLTQKDQLGEKLQTFWNPESLATGKRQRLPPLDWRRGEVYLRSSDGTVIGKEGFENLVFDDVKIYEKKSKPHRRVSADESTAPEESSVKKKNKGKRKSSNSSRRSIINAFDFMEKDADGIYCIGNHRILLRSSDRSWGPRMDDQGGFRLAPSIVTDDAFIAEIALEPGCASGKESETVPPSQAVYGRVLQAEANSVRIVVNGKEERLSEEDEFFLDEGCSYLMDNLSKDRTAVLSLTAFS